MYAKKRMQIDTMSEILHVLGVDVVAFREVNQDNMEDFNNYLASSEEKRVMTEMT